MEEYIVTFRTVTPAQRGESVLQNMQISSSLQRTPRWMEAQGCGYSLRVKCEDIQTVIKCLRDKNVHFRKIYRKKENGAVEEVRL